uniref:NADH-ubiquinone oxidoreductase chain 5 n=1 Tax=Lepidapion squamigerum TaxID=280314 RepID=A0A6B9ETC4_9CUCU|nr:NADH dehydrogenase subunit 5 [Lepidapion squamigerum]
MMKINQIYMYMFMICSLILFMLGLKFLIEDFVLMIEYSVINLNSISLVLIFLFDWMSLLFMSFVLFISSMVIFYSEEYMSMDLNMNRFILLVVMFVLSMILLILSPNLVSILLGWDGLGLVSYALVIYYQNVKSFNAGMLTALTNRIGDVALLMSIAWMMNFGSWNFINYLSFMKNDFEMQIITWFVILAAMTKSAQIPFSSWLPAAMAAPTPVSSLVHSSTLVTAGVYLLIRFNYSFTENMMYFLLFFSVLTMFMSGLAANFEYDLKKIIALSTLSQLGLMMSILSLGDYKLSFFHLLVHALFKALLFMCAGNIIHNMLSCQDIRFMGSVMNFMPLTSTFFNISNFSLCGLPFLSGFYSKDMILEVMSMQYLNLFIYIMFYLSIGLTVSYSFRLTYYLLTGNFNFLSLSMLNEDNLIMLKSMAGLIFFVVFSGSMLSWMMFLVPYFIMLPVYMKNMALFMILIGMWLGYEMAHFKINYSMNSILYLAFSSFFCSMWNMPVLSTLGVNYYPIYLGEVYLKFFDQGWLEYYGSKNLNFMFTWSSQMMQLFFKHHLKIYFMLIIVWIVLLIFLI